MAGLIDHCTPSLDAAFLLLAAPQTCFDLLPVQVICKPSTWPRSGLAEPLGISCDSESCLDLPVCKPSLAACFVPAYLATWRRVSPSISSAISASCSGSRTPAASVLTADN